MLNQRINLEDKMKTKRWLWGIFCSLVFLTTSGQSNLQFCVQVNDRGECLTPSNKFEVEPSGGTVSFLINHLQTENFVKIRYKIFYLRENGDEDFLIGIDQKTQPDWQFAWQDVVLFDPGKYKIKVYQVDSNSNESFLCLNTLSIVASK